MVTIKRIRVGSAFKIGAIFSVLTWAVFGVIFVLLPSSMFSLYSVNNFNATAPSNSLSTAGLASCGIFYFVGLALYGVVGGIGAAVGAFLYNLVANWVGGLEVELESLEKPKRTETYDERPTF